MGAALGVGAAIFLVACGQPPKWGMVLGVIVGALAIAVFVGGSSKQAAITERVVGTDEDEWEPRTEHLSMDLRTGDYSKQYMEVEGISWVDIQQFAQEIHEGAPATVHSWTGPGALFTRSKFDRLMGRFETLGWIVNYGPAGRRLTADGEVAFRKLARGDFSVIIE